MSDREERREGKSLLPGVIGKIILVLLLAAAIVALGMYLGSRPIGSLPFIKDIPMKQDGVDVTLAEYKLGDKKVGDITIGQAISLVNQMSASPEEIKANLITEPVNAEVPQEVQNVYGAEANYLQAQYTDTPSEVAVTGATVGAIVNNILKAAVVGEEGEAASLAELGLTMEQMNFKTNDDGTMEVSAVASLKLTDLPQMPAEVKEVLDKIEVGTLFLQLNFTMAQQEGALVYSSEGNKSASINGSKEVTDIFLPLINEVLDTDCVGFISEKAGILLGSLISNMGHITEIDSNGGLLLETNVAE